MALDGTFLRTKVARRILGLFLGGAFLPIVVLTVISYGLITNQLQEQSWERLRQTRKILGLNMMGRLEVLDAGLRSVSIWLSEQPDPRWAAREAEGRVPVGLGDLVLRRLDGRLLTGRADPSIPPLSPGQQGHACTATWRPPVTSGRRRPAGS